MNQSLPPAAIEAEQALLGGILFDPRKIVTLKETLPVEAFFVGNHQTIYRSMIFVDELGYEADIIQLSSYLESKELLESVGGTTALARLLNQTVSASNCDRYARLILEKWERRKLIALGYQIAELGSNGSQSLDDIYQAVREMLPEAITGNPRVVHEPVITKATYTVVSQSGQKKLELEVDVKDDWNLADSIATVAAKAKLVSENLWGEEIK